MGNLPMLSPEADIEHAPFPLRPDCFVQEVRSSLAILARYRCDFGFNGVTRKSLGPWNERQCMPNMERRRLF